MTTEYRPKVTGAPIASVLAETRRRETSARREFYSGLRRAPVTPAIAQEFGVDDTDGLVALYNSARDHVSAYHLPHGSFPSTLKSLEHLARLTRTAIRIAGPAFHRGLSDDTGATEPHVDDLAPEDWLTPREKAVLASRTTSVTVLHGVHIGPSRQPHVKVILDDVRSHLQGGATDMAFAYQNYIGSNRWRRELFNATIAARLDPSRTDEGELPLPDPEPLPETVRVDDLSALVRSAMAPLLSGADAGGWSPDQIRESVNGVLDEYDAAKTALRKLLGK